MTFSTLIQNRFLTITTIMLRNPSIKFRYGTINKQQKPSSSSQGKMQSVSVNPSGQQQQSGNSIYDFQLPQRWRRRPISDEECAYINRGGPD